MFDAFSFSSKANAHTRSTSSPNAHISVRKSFTSDSSYDESILATPPKTYTSRPRQAHHSVNHSPVSPPSVAQSAGPFLSSTSLPTKAEHFANKFVGAHIGSNKKGDIRGVLADWFQGESKPLSFSIIPSAKEMDPMETISLSTSPNSTPQTDGALPAFSEPPIASRFSFLSSKSSVPKPTSSFADSNDELLNIDVSKELFSNGPTDSSSPAAYKNLVKKVEELVSGLQTALRERTMSLNEIKAQEEAQSNMLNDLEIRASHLKKQLDGMTAKLAEQDDAMMTLVDELAQEKQLRREEEDARKRSVMLVKSSRAEVTSADTKKRNDRSLLPQKDRASIVSDSGFESEGENSIYSVSLKNMGMESPAMSTSSFSATTSPDIAFKPELKCATDRSQTQSSRPLAPPQRLSTFQNVIKGLSGRSRNDEPQVSSCSKCSEAWNIVKMLQEENQALKQKLDQMESAVDDSLNLIAGMGI